MHDAYETHDDHTPFRASIVPHTDPPNPRSDYDHMGTMYARYRGYDLGDVPERDVPTSWDDLLATVIERGATVALPLYLYDHGGLSMSAGDPIDLRGVTVHEDEDEDSDTYGETFVLFPGDNLPSPNAPRMTWDTSMVGIIVDSDEGRHFAFGPDPDDAAPYDDVVRYLRGEVTEYGQYLTGDVWGYVVTDTRTGDEVDSCWGFYGLDDARGQALDVAARWKRDDGHERAACATCNDPYAHDVSVDLASLGRNTWTVTDPVGNVWRFHPAGEDDHYIQLVPVCTDPHAQTPETAEVSA